MGEVVDFELRNYNVLFNLPDQKIIHLRKRSNDNVTITIDGDHGTAMLQATTKRAAEARLKRIFPDCIIVDVLLK